MDSFLSIVTSALSLAVLLYLPGLALVRAGSTSLPETFARVLASAIVTTLVGTGLAAAESFSLRNLLVADAVAAVALFALRSRLAPVGLAEPAPRDFVGPALFVLALASAWPAYPVFLGGSDATAYVASGISLGRHGTLGRPDLLGPAIPPDVRATIFDSMSQVFLEPGPPYRRVPGAMLLENLTDRTAWPCFFPVPSVWAAISAVRGGDLDEQRAPDFAPAFAALALWAFWQIARQWLGAPWGAAATVLLGATDPWFTAAHMPMSEPIAAFFVLGGLAFASAASRSRHRTDALLAGAALGAAVFTRVEMAVLLVLAFALVPAFSRRGDETSRPLPFVFFATLAAIASLTVVEAATLPGTYVSPLFDHWGNARVNYLLRFGPPSGALVAGAIAAAVAVFALLVRLFGLSATVRWGILIGAIAGQSAASRFLYDRTPMWLSFYVGWTGLALFVVGGVLAWRRRDTLPGGALLLALAAVTSAILFYNPHVYPALPWGARRYVPVLLPMLVLLATFTARCAAERSRAAGVVLVAALAVPIAMGVRTTIAEPVVAGAWEQLREVSKAIPQPSVILVDRELSRLMIAPSLWLIMDRNNVTVPPIDTKVGSEVITKLAHHFWMKWPVYYVTRAGDHRRPPFVSMVAAGKATVRLRSLESTYDRRPQRVLASVVPITVYKLGKSADKRPGFVK